jgi:TP901 family phage tail tape measure protein
MSFFAGAVIAKAIMDTTQWVSGSKTMGSTMKRMGGGFSVLGLVATAAIGTITAAFVKSVMSANEWQKEFANVTTLVDESKVNTQEMALELLKLDSRLGDTTDLTNGLYQALSASVDPAQSVMFVGEAAKFAKAALVDTNTAVDVITTGLNAYGMEADSVTQISDQLFSVIKLGKVTGDELAATIGQSIPLAANMGIEFNELGASIAIMTRQGINASQATTQFNAVVNAFLKPSKDMEQTLKQIGFESGSAAIESLGFKGALDAVTETTGGSKEELAGMFRNVRALRGVMALTGEGASDFSEVLDEVTNSAGATEEAFSKQELTFETLKNTAGKLSIVVGNIGKTFVDELAVGANEAANSMIDFLLSSQGAQLVSTIIANLAAGFETLKLILEPLVNTILKEAKEIWNHLTKELDKMTGSTAQGAGGFQVLAGATAFADSAFKVFSEGIKSAITHIANLVDVITTSAKVVGDFFDFLGGKKTWEDVSRSADEAGKAIEKTVDDVVTNIGKIWDTIFDEAETFDNRTNKLADDLEVKWKVTYTNVETNTQQTYNRLITGQQGFTQALKESNQGVLDSFKTTNASIESNTKQHIDNQKTAWEEYFEGIKEQAQDTSQTMTTLFDESANALSDAFTDVFMSLGEMWAGGEEASESFWETIKESGKEAIVTILKALAKEFGIRALAAFIPGPSFNPIAGAGYVAAAAAALVAAGAVSALATGGVGSGLTLVGEEGPELVDFGTPSRVYSANETRGMLNGSGTTMNNTFNVYNKNSADYMMEKLGTRFDQKGKSLYG